MNSLLPINVNDLLHGKSVEWERLEFKKGWNPLAIMQTLSAFANDFHNLGGGYVIIGVEEKDGRPILPPQGLKTEEIDKIQKELLNLGNSVIQPTYYPIAVPCEVQGRQVLILWAMGGSSRPYKAKLSLGKGGQGFAHFIRKGSTTVRARGDDERELMSLASRVPFDDRFNSQAKVEDLSTDLMKNYLERVGSDLADQVGHFTPMELGQQMRLLGGPQEAPFPLNVGLLMFNAEPHQFLPGTQIDVVWFPEEGPGGDKFSEKIFRGPLPEMIGDTLAYIRRSFISETVIKHPDRAESTRVKNVPYEAIEEAVVNAVYHRAYDEREPVEVRIMHDEVVVLSYPGPDRSVSLEQLRAGKAHSRRYRNRRIGEFLKELEFTEGRGTGIPKILKAMRDNGSPEPVFEFDEDHSFFMVKLPVHPAALEVVDKAEDDDIATGSPTQSPTQSADPVGRLLKQLEDGEKSSGELRKALGLKHRPTFRENYLHPALEQEFIELTIPEKPSSRLQKYRITEKGRKYLENRGN